MPNRRQAAGSTARPAGRVPRHTLSRPRIIDAALALIDAEGLDQVTMPRLAERLGVGTMSLYRHVQDKDDLIDGVAERVLSGVEVPAGEPDDWEGRVVGYLRRLRDQALAHPALSRILAERGLTVGPVFAQLEEVHGILRAAGFSDSDAVRTFYALLTYVFGFVIWELPRVHRQPASAYTTAWNDAVEQLDPGAYPHLHALRHELTTTASPEQFEYGLNHLIQSLRPAIGSPGGRSARVTE
jgi:TetR/AcrR family tetracycline transcriptional repressor